jgi:multisubunit Na+/H+ antiporter MnhB subunit
MNMSEVPALSISTTLLASEKICALRLVSDSIAQQRQTLNRRIITHPYFLAPTLLLFAVIIKLNYHRTSDLSTVTILLAGVTIALLSLVSRYSSEYLERAEAVGNANGLRSFVDAPEREVIIAKWGERVIGTVVLSFFEGNMDAQVWTWTVERRYRGKGLGRDLVPSYQFLFFKC